MPSFDLDLKKQKVYEVISGMCVRRDMPFPAIEFNDCPRKQLAHYHADNNKICISERHLMKQSYDGLPSVLTKELGHILTAKAKDKSLCNVCGKKVKLTKCRHCKDYYCDEHLQPYDPKKKQNKGHPCHPFTDSITIRKEEYNEEKAVPPVQIIKAQEFDEKKLENISEKLKAKPEKGLIGTYVFIIFCVLLSIGIIFVLDASKREIVEVQSYNYTTTETFTRYENTTADIRFATYPNLVGKKEVSLACFLERRIVWQGTSGVHVFLMKDDHNNEIYITNKKNELSQMIPKPGTTKSLYLVNGLLEKGFNRLEIEIEDIDPYQRKSETRVFVENRTTVEPVMTRLTKPKYPTIQKIVYRILGNETV